MDKSGGWNLSAWLRTAGHPIVLRVPPGYAPLLLGGLLVLLTLAYWVGLSRGQRAAQLEPTRSETAGGAETGAIRIYDPRDPDDPRQPGYYYFSVADYPEAEARRLVGFLSDYGVDAGAFRHNNGRLARVFVLRGFTEQELVSERRQYEKKLRLLGRRWKDLHDGADNLAQLHMTQHQVVPRNLKPQARNDHEP